MATKAPVLKRKNSSERWGIDIPGVNTTQLNSTEYQVVVKQHNRKYYYSDGPIIDGRLYRLTS